MPRVPITPKNGSFHVGFGRFSLDITSGNLLTILILLGLFGIISGAGYHITQVVALAQAEHAVIREEHRAVHEITKDYFEAMLFMLGTPEGKRPELAMPKMLRDRMIEPSQ